MGKLKNFFHTIFLSRYYILAMGLQVSFILLIVYFALGLRGCAKDSPVSIQSLGQLNTFSLVDKNSINLTFSKKIIISDVSLKAKAGDDSIPLKKIDYIDKRENDEDGDFSTLLTFSSPMAGLTFYTLTFSVEGTFGGKVNLSLDLPTFNDKKPLLQLITVQTKSSRGKEEGEKIATPAIMEYVEFRALTAGNLFGLLVYSVNDGEGAAVEFGNKAVKKGDVIRAQFRQSPDSRSYLNNSSDIVLLHWSDDGTFADILPYSDGTYKTWKNSTFGEAIRKGRAQGLWSGGDDPPAAASVKGATVTRPLVRINDKKDATAWSIQKSKKAPSFKNVTPTPSKSLKKEEDKLFSSLEPSPLSGEIFIKAFQPKFSGAGGIFNSEYVTLSFNKPINVSELKFYFVRSKSQDKTFILTSNEITPNGEKRFDFATSKESDTDLLDNNMGAILLLDKKDALIDFVYYKRDGAETNSPDKIFSAIKAAQKYGLWDEGENLFSTPAASLGKKSSYKPLKKIGTKSLSSNWTLKSK